MDISAPFLPMILASGVKPWALGVFVVMIGLLGMLLLSCSYDDRAGDDSFWKSELFKGKVTCQ